MKKLLTPLLILILCSISYAQWDNSHWQTVSVMPIPVKGAKAVVQDTVIYIVGGYSDSVLTGTKKIQAYFPESNQWRVLNDSITVPRQGHSLVSYGDSVYIFGGASTSNDSSYSIEGWGYQDKSKIRWTDYNFNRSFSATVIFEEFLYVFGGYQNHELYDSLSYLIRFDMNNGDVLDSFAINDSFSYGEDLPSHQMAAHINNGIYVFGGIFGPILRSISYFDLNTYTWNEMDATLNKPLASSVALPHPDHNIIMLIGGKNEQKEALSSVEIFNIFSHETISIDSLSFARSEHTAVNYNNIVYVFGGKNAENKIVTKVERLEIPAVTGLPQRESLAIRDFELLGNYPNPFNPVTDIRIMVNEPQQLSITIYDIQGREIKSLLNDVLARGRHNITWDATDNFQQSVSSGIYFYTVSSNNMTQTNRMLLIK